MDASPPRDTGMQPLCSVRFPGLLDLLAATQSSSGLLEAGSSLHTQLLCMVVAQLPREVVASPGQGAGGSFPALTRGSLRTRLFLHHKNPSEWGTLLGVGGRISLDTSWG